jgi:hypothetical protein
MFMTEKTIRPKEPPNQWTKNSPINRAEQKKTKSNKSKLGAQTEQNKKKIRNPKEPEGKKTKEKHKCKQFLKKKKKKEIRNAKEKNKKKKCSFMDPAPRETPGPSVQKLYCFHMPRYGITWV